MKGRWIVDILAARNLSIIVVHVQESVVRVQAREVKPGGSHAELLADCLQHVAKSCVERGFSGEKRQRPVECGYLAIGKRFGLLARGFFGALMFGDINDECYGFCA